MSGVADGATTRRERLFELLSYIATREPEGPSLLEIQQHADFVHGLTWKKTAEYIHQMQLTGVLTFQGGKVHVNPDNYARLMALMFPDRKAPDVSGIV